MSNQVMEEVEGQSQSNGAGLPPVPPPAPERRRNPKPFILGALLLIAIGAVVAYFYFLNRESTDDAQVDGHLVMIAPKISGQVVEVLVTDNQAVKKGQVIARIDPRDYQARVDQAKAALLQAQSAVHGASVTVPLTRDTTFTGTTSAQAALANAEAEYQRSNVAAEQASGADLAYAEANVQAKQADNDRAQSDLERMKPLVAKEEISKLQFDSYVAAAKVAASDLHAAQQRLASARKQAEIQKVSVQASATRVAQARALVEQSKATQKQVAVRTADLGSANAQVAAAQAALEAAELQLSYTVITAPMDGVVTRKVVEVGQMLAPGQGMLTLVPLNDVWITANFKETQLAHVRVGQKVEIDVDMYDRTVTGHVDSIAGATGARLSLLPPENATGNFVKVVQRIPVKIVLDPLPEGVILRPGMNIDATILTK